eukprot:4619701-Pleurochrysis_carterae.AAC.2
MSVAELSQERSDEFMKALVISKPIDSLQAEGRAQSHSFRTKGAQKEHSRCRADSRKPANLNKRALIAARARTPECVGALLVLPLLAYEVLDFGDARLRGVWQRRRDGALDGGREHPARTQPIHHLHAQLCTQRSRLVAVVLLAQKVV